MLILTRRVNEKIIIPIENGKIIEIALMGIKGMQARLGINAPKEIAVHREEIYKKIINEKKIEVTI